MKVVQVYKKNTTRARENCVHSLSTISSSNFIRDAMSIIKESLRSATWEHFYSETTSRTRLIKLKHCSSVRENAIEMFSGRRMDDAGGTFARHALLGKSSGFKIFRRYKLRCT